MLSASLAKVPSNSSSIKEGLMDPDPHKVPTSLKVGGKSVSTLDYTSSQGEESLNIKQEPEEKELTFQTIGLQDITLDDVSEIIVRDLFDTPDSGNASSMP